MSEPKTLPIVPGKLTFDASDPEVQWILSRMIFTTGPIAHIFQKAGYPIPQHAEEEHAHVTLWMLARYQEHGADWRKKCDVELASLVHIAKQ